MFDAVRKESGFTLIELLIVVAIIGILAAVAIPQLSSFRIKGYNSNAISDMRVFRTTMEAICAEHSGYPGGL